VALAAFAFLRNSGAEPARAPAPTSTVRAEAGQPPNILFFIMDDVGIDQMQIFGYGGDTPPRTPNIHTVARAGKAKTGIKT
jgi:hypothetical protein